MAEPAVLLRSVPVLDVGGDHHNAALVQADGGLAFLLVPALASRAEQELTASFVCVVDMPVVAASRLEGHVGGEQAAFRIGQRIQERIAGEVLGIYALCWQQVIKRVELSVAYANRAMALLWSLLWAVLLFGEQITVKKLIGVGLVLAGTLIINGGKEQENHD